MRSLPPHHRPTTTDRIEVARIEPVTRVLGPGARRALWTQGCALRCRGCVVPESHARDAGRPMDPEQLAQRLLEGPDVEGLTISGGEPMLHAGGLVTTIRALRAARPAWTFMSYSGYRLDILQRRGTAEQRALIGELDLLVDGPYVASLGPGLLWRGSSNQRLLALTRRGHEAIADLADTPAGVEITVMSDGRLSWTGVPVPGFRGVLDAALLGVGFVVEHDPDPAAAHLDDHDERNHR